MKLQKKMSLSVVEAEIEGKQNTPTPLIYKGAEWGTFSKG